ncbi:MAG: type IV pilus biogenesis/stability protein PilW [Zoogloeaceae bacterium]|nr:type IV pilus biogenesis/stability protein PilW [Zoogloeaceae bacterium]
MKRMWVLAVVSGAILLTGCAAGGGAGGGFGGGAVVAERPLLDLPPTNERERGALVHVELGTAYFEVGRYDVALDEARIALAHVPSFAPAFHLMGMVYMFIEDPAAARDNFRRALAAAPNDPDFNNRYGWFLCLNGDEREGLERLDLAARNPYYRFPARPQTNAGLCHLSKGQYEEAEPRFRRALALQGDNIVAQYGLAEVIYRKGDYAGARRMLVALHQQADPTAESAWLGLRVERKLGNRAAEASYAAQLEGRFKDSPQYLQMKKGEYE